MERRPLKLGVLGAGMIATSRSGVLPGLAHLTDKVELAAVADAVPEKAREAQGQFGIPRTYASLDEMLEGEELDVVANLTPIPAHGATNLQILAAGKHLVCEKPIATTMEDADEIVEAANARGLKVVIAPPNMVQPVYERVRAILDEGTIGKVAYARLRSSNPGPGSSWWPSDPTWFYQEGSGPLFDMGVYGIHEATGFLGPAKRVTAFSGITEPTRVVGGGPFAGKQIEVTADDNTLLMLDFGGATFAVIDGTFNMHATKAPKVEIYGRTGVIHMNDYHTVPLGAPPLEVYRADIVPEMGGWTTPRSWPLSTAQERADRLGRAILVDHLVDCVWEVRHPVLSAEHARHALEIMLMAIESARSGRAIELTTTF